MNQEYTYDEVAEIISDLYKNSPNSSMLVAEALEVAHRAYAESCSLYVKQNNGIVTIDFAASDKTTKGFLILGRHGLSSSYSPKYSKLNYTEDRKIETLDDDRIARKVETHRDVSYKSLKSQYPNYGVGEDTVGHNNLAVIEVYGKDGKLDYQYAVHAISLDGVSSHLKYETMQTLRSDNNTFVKTVLTDEMNNQSSLVEHHNPEPCKSLHNDKSFKTTIERGMHNHKHYQSHETDPNKISQAINELNQARDHYAKILQQHSIKTNENIVF